MGLLGGVGTPHILWHLKAYPRRFSELKDDIDSVGEVLTQRLKELADIGLVARYARNGTHRNSWLQIVRTGYSPIKVGRT